MPLLVKQNISKNIYVFYLGVSLALYVATYFVVKSFFDVYPHATYEIFIIWLQDVVT